MMNYKTVGLIAGLILTASLAACSSKPASTNQVAPASPTAETTTPGNAMSGDAMKKEGDAMQKSGDAMSGDAMSGDAMKKEGDAMQKSGDAMSGDAMKKDGDAMQQSPSPAKP
jgi:pentapeptide MXKDX repeat protein